MNAPINNTQLEQVVLFADVSGSTRLYEVLGDARAFAAIHGCLDILRQLTVAHGGRVVKNIGDEIMAVFPSALIATHAACEMQLQVDSQPPIDKVRVAIRIGYHFGPVLESQTDGDVFGDTVNVAARLAGIAQAQQIMTSESTVLLLPPIIRSSTRRFSNLPIKGKNDSIAVCEVLWQDSEEMTMMVGNTFSNSVLEPTLSVSHQGQTWQMDKSKSLLTIGRDELADIVVADRRASRMHARIERRGEKFIFVDLSSNGSFILVNGETEIQLRREEFVMRESGHISLGHAYQADPTEIIEFCYNAS